MKTGIEDVLRTLSEEGRLNDEGEDHALDLIDLDYLEVRAREFKEAFPEDFISNLYCIKVNSFSKVCNTLFEAGMGAECASIPEVEHSLRLGVKPEMVAYYAPCRSKVRRS